MTRVQFLNDLYRRLGALSREEAEQHLTYYAEMLADRIEEGMTEEEAVASMEDVDTISRRILEDAGIRSERGAEPSVDDAVTQAMAETEKPRRRWVKPLVITVIAALVLSVLILAVPVVLFAINVVDSEEGIAHFQEDITIDVEDGDIISVTSKPDRENPTDNSDGPVVDVVGDTYAVAADGIRDINIEWVSGTVIIEAGEGDDIVFAESSTSELEEVEKLTYTLRNGELTITFAQQGLKTFSKTKNLTVQLPAELVLNEIEVDTVSAAVEISGGTAIELNLESTSGNFLVNGSFGKVSAETISGEVTLEGSFASIEVDTTSGNLTVEESGTLAKLDVETVSGDVELSLPATAAFDLHYETASGELDSGGFALKQTSGENYTVGGGGNRFEVETVSGNLTLKSS